jgi:hypothetical protein
MLKNSVLIISTETTKNYDCLNIDNKNDRYIYFDDYEYATGYLLACEEKNFPETILIDNDRFTIQKFKDLCSKFQLNLQKSTVINSLGETIFVQNRIKDAYTKPEKHLN